MFLVCLFNFLGASVHASEFSVYMNLMGYGVSEHQGYRVVSESAYEPVGGAYKNLSEWVEVNITNGERDENVFKWMSYHGMHGEVDVYMPKIAPMLLKHISLKFSDIKEINTSAEPVFVLRRGDAYAGALMILHCFTRDIMGEVFYQRKYLEFDSELASKIMLGIDVSIKESSIFE